MPSSPSFKQLLSEASIREVLITLDDFPTGWTATNQLGDSKSNRDDDCSLDVMTYVKPTTEVRTGFSKATFGPYFIQVVSVYPADQVKSVWDRLLADVRRCKQSSGTDDKGKVTITTYAPLSFPKIGDDVVAVRESQPAGLLGIVNTDFICVRRGPTITAYGHVVVGLGGVDSDFTETMVRKADAKLSKAIR